MLQGEEPMDKRENGTLVQVKILTARKVKILAGFPCEERDMLILDRDAADGTTDLVYWIRHHATRRSQVQFLTRVENELRAELASLRQREDLRGKTLFQWWAAPAPCPEHDETFLNRTTWRATMLAMCQ